MRSILLLKADLSSFGPSEMAKAFAAHSNFRNLEFDAHYGGPVACEYIDSDGFALIHLSDDRECISLSNTGTSALGAIVNIQKALGIPLRMCDSCYSFDLTFSDISSVEELEAAMDNSPTS
jgi:hypothetical protein